MRTLDISRLTTCNVAQDGQAISLSGEDDAGQAFSLHISVEQAGTLAMTLPQLLNAAIQAQYRDTTIRYAFPLGAFNVAAVQGSNDAILSLKTPDGFEVNFTVSAAVLGQLATECGVPDKGAVDAPQFH